MNYLDLLPNDRTKIINRKVQDLHMRTTKEDISRSSYCKKDVCSQPLLLNPLL